MTIKPSFPFADYEKLYHSLLQVAGECILFLDSTLKIVESSQGTYDLYRLPYGSLIAQDFRHLIGVEDRNILDEVFNGMGAHSSWKGKVNGIYADGEIFPVEIKIKRMGSDDRSHFCIAISDRTEYESLAERLNEERSHRREMYVTLRNVMNSVEKEKKGVERLIAHKIETLLLPTLEKIERENSKTIQKTYLNLLRDQLLNLTKAFPRELDISFIRLTRTEMKICQCLQAGYSTKEIADTLNISFETTQTHRKNIRKKLGLHGRKISLYTFLTTRRSLGSVDNL